jgi:hypothetical protein
MVDTPHSLHPWRINAAVVARGAYGGVCGRPPWISEMFDTEPRSNGTVDSTPTSRPIERGGAATIVVSCLDRTTHARSIAVAPWGDSNIEGGRGVASTRYGADRSRTPESGYDMPRDSHIVQYYHARAINGCGWCGCPEGECSKIRHGAQMGQAEYQYPSSSHLQSFIYRCGLFCLRVDSETALCPV